MDPPYSVQILEECHISPPPNSTHTTSIPLTFFDIPWLICHPVKRIFFYELPHPTLHFTNIILPQLKHSLSLTLQHFFPLAGTVVLPPQPNKPYILYKHGDSIPLTIAESNGDFSHLLKNYPRDVREFHPFVPPLLQETTDVLNDTDQGQVQVLRPLIAIQVTLFPNSGICIGYAFRHAVADGRAINHFIKSWASIFKFKDDISLSAQPLHDRAALIEDPNGFLPIIWNQICELGLTWDHFASTVAGAATPLEDKLRATFVMGRLQINKLKHRISSQFKNTNTNEPPPLLHVSTFVATCAFLWVCYMKTENIVAPPLTNSNDTISNSEDDFLHHFSFFADSTGERAGFHIPKTYFGNCLTLCYCSVRKSELLGENGLSAAAISIMKGIKELENGDLKRWPLTWITKGIKMHESGRLIGVAGSPKLRVYETDFGWGRPRKNEVVHIDESGSISLAECRDEEGGVEAGLALSKAAMDSFISIFEIGLKNGKNFSRVPSP